MTLPAVIVGGGPAGAMAAIHLARAGMAPVLLERHRSPHETVCGGFFSADAITRLEQAGLTLAQVEGRRIDRVRIAAGSAVTEAPLPFRAAGIARSALDTVLLDRAAALGADVRRGVTVRQVDPVARGVQIAGGASIAADALFLATGKHEVRGGARPLENREGSLGFRTSFDADAALIRALDGVVELHGFAGGYAGLLLFGTDRVNLSLSVSPARFRAAGGRIGALLDAIAGEAPLLADRLAGAALEAQWASISGVPYGWRAHEGIPGLFRLGDQGAVIASLAGDGLGGALASAELASAAFLSDGPRGAIGYQRRYARRTRWPLAMGEMIRRVAERPAVAAPLIRALGLAPRLAGYAAARTRL